MTDSGASRLKALAFDGAKLRHFGAVEREHPHEDFSTCPHPDCALVRSSSLEQPAQGSMEKAIFDMRRASELIDNAEDGTHYQLGLISLALMARKFLRDVAPLSLSASATKGDANG